MRRRPRFWRDLRGAWETLADLPLPETFPGRGESSGDGRMLPWFPILGALCGAGIAAVGMLAAVLTNRIAGAALFALLALAFMLLKDSGRGVLLIVSFVDCRLECGSFAAALPRLSADRSVLTGRRFCGVLAAVLVILEFIVLFLLGLHGAAFFLVAVLTGSFAVQGMLAAAEPESGGAALIPDEDGLGRRRLLIAAAVAAVFMLWRFPVATAFSVAAGVAAVSWFGGFIRRECGTPEPEHITLSGALAEAGFLICGFLWAL